ncbi:hypothetical protein PO909_011658 [Leuciscus waleckii]
MALKVTLKMGFASTVDLCPLVSTGIPHPSGYALVSRRSTCSIDFRDFSCDLYLHLFGSGALLLPSCFVSVLWSPGSTSVARFCCSALPYRTFVIARSLQSLASTWVSTPAGFVSFWHSPSFIWQGSPMAPPSLDSALGLRPGPSAEGSTLAPPSFISTLALLVPCPCSASAT